MPPQPLSLFISYSHRDEVFKQELEDHLALLKRQDKISPWQDRQIEAGTEWNDQIREALDAADIILLLISPRFMNSDFCYGKEMQRAMQRHQNGAARVIPIILTPTDWKGAPFDKLQVLPKDGKPVVDWPNHDAAFVDVVKGIRRAVETLSPTPEQKQDAWASPPRPNAARPPSTEDSEPRQVPRYAGAALARNHDKLFADLSAGPKPARDSERERSAKRMQLFTALSSLPGPQFSQLVFTLNPPLGNVPPDSAPQSNRVAALLQWADSPIGPGLAMVGHLLSEIMGSPRST
ncbi:MAG: toll/interleukin-1 receptor domain-containing protein [Tildeniella torsiva UHER 1998/13D]|jgi:hypothetical protein|nr:toll/interleukin-1 receptor domain-containing protein [Tildeniella torsiva UHER 1998/13D]